MTIFHPEFTSSNIEEYYEQLEAKILDSRMRQLKIQSSFPGFLDISAASSMNLYSEDIIDAFSGEKCAKLIQKYPSLYSRDRSFEEAVCEMIKKYIGKEFHPDNITSYGGGVYGSYHSILHALSRNNVLLPRLLHQTHKFCISMTGVNTIEIDYTQEYLLDTEHIEKELQRLKPGSALIYINHNRGPNISEQYIIRLSELLVRYDALCIYDADVIYSSHDGITKPYIPLLSEEFLLRSIVLINLTKEHGAPGLRIGIGVSGKNIAQKIGKYQKASLSMISPITEFLAIHIIKSTNLCMIEGILRERMNCMIQGWEMLGWENIRKPSIGINLFIDIPKSFQQQVELPGDELFYFYVLTRTGILIRPGSIYGKCLGNQVRPVICQPLETMENIFAILEQKKIYYNMPLPKGIISEFKKIVGIH